MIKLVKILVALGLLAALPATAEQLATNQGYLDGVRQDRGLDMRDPIAIFDFVMGALPPRVKVYPTENYYYFSFAEKGVTWAGNIRLDASDRDDGFVNFAYFEEFAYWRPAGDTIYRHLSKADGVEVVKLAELSYQVSFRGKSVIFDLNDLRGVKPPEGLLNAAETYIGPSFDESGVRFFLVFNKEAKVFHYLLDESVDNAEQFDQTTASPHIMLGRRTGFAFYTDRKDAKRKILVGVFGGSSRLNNYFDGPFDQLPDNFLQGDALRDAVLTLFPEMRGKIDRFAAKPGGEDRYGITPYIYYWDVADLKIFDACLDDKARPETAYYQCFNQDGYGEGEDDAADGKQDTVQSPVVASPTPAVDAPVAPKP